MRSSKAKLLLRSQRAVCAAVGASQAARLGPDPSALAHPKIAAGASSETVKGSMEALANTTLDAEAPESDLSVSARLRVAISHQAAVVVDIGMLRLQHVKVLRRADSEAYVALKVSWLIVVTLFAGSVLRKVLGSSHDKLRLVICVGHASGVNGLIEISVHGGQMNKGLVVQVIIDFILNIVGQTLNARGQGRA